jgi:hypothetical protein
VAGLDQVPGADQAAGAGAADGDLLFPRTMEDVLAAAKQQHKCTVLSPHWFLSMNADDYVAVLKSELKKKFPRLSYPTETINLSRRR